MKYTGIVEKVIDKSGRTKKGKPYTLFNFKLEDGEWFGLPFDVRPAFMEGDNIEFEGDKNDNGYLTVFGDVRIIPKPAPQASGGASSGSGNQSNGANGSAGSERQTQIVLQHSQEMALKAVALLLANDGLPVAKAATKAGTAKRFDVIVAAVDKLTVKYYNDVVTGRLLEAIEDMGIIDVEPDAGIPGPPGESTADTNGDKY